MVQLGSSVPVGGVRLYDTDYYTPEQFNVYIERRNFEYKSQQKWICEQNTVQVGLNKVKEIDRMLDEYLKVHESTMRKVSDVRELLRLKRETIVNVLS